MQRYIFFHKPQEQNGYLSNWYKSNFVFQTTGIPKELQNNKAVTLREGLFNVVFTSMEQFMMFSKAILFKDNVVANKILNTTDVAQIKQLGREVHNYDDSVWSREGYAIVVTGLVLKFSQNKDLRQKLLGTNDAILAECAVKDKKWGIGLSMQDGRRFDERNWQGENLLGKALMETRMRLKNSN